MTRFLVPALLFGLLVAQVGLLVPAYKRAQVRLIEAVYARPPDGVYRGPTEMLGAGQMARLLREAVSEARAVDAGSTPGFEETTGQFAARFGLLQGDARAVAERFGAALTAAATDALRRKVPTAPAPGAFMLTAVSETRPAWLRPLDLLAATVNIVAIVVWFRRRGRMARESAG